MIKETERIGNHGYRSREQFWEVPTGSTIDPDAAKKIHTQVKQTVKTSVINIMRGNGIPRR